MVAISAGRIVGQARVSLDSVGWFLNPLCLKCFKCLIGFSEMMAFFSGNVKNYFHPVFDILIY